MFVQDVSVVGSISPASYGAGTTNGTAVDTSGYDEAMIVLHCGVTTATGTLNVKVQEADTSGGSYADITGAAFTQVSPSNDEAVYVGLLRLEGGRKRFIRAVGVGATAASIYGVTIVLGDATVKPAQTPQWSK